MSKYISLIAFGTFGNPYGFRQTFFGSEGNEALKNIKSFDLNTVAIKLFPKSRVYSIRKEKVLNYKLISYSVYDFANEPNSTRGGTFIGSSILFVDRIADESITINCLNEFQENLKNKNVQNDTILVNHSDKFSVNKPKDFDKIVFHLKEIEDLSFIQFSKNILVVYCDISAENLKRLFTYGIDLLNVYDLIYFTDSHEIAEFVNQKGIFKLIQDVSDKRDLELEIKNLQEERKRKRDLSISEFEKEIQKLEDDRSRTLNDFRNLVEQNEKCHQENELKIKESKNDLEKINHFYSDFSDKIRDLANQLKSDKKLDDVKLIYNENKKIFISAISQLKRPDFVNKIPKAIAKSNLRIEPHFQNQEFQSSQIKSGKKEEREEYRIDIFKVATLLLLIVLIGTWVYFLFFNPNFKQQASQIPQQKVDSNIESPIQQPIPTVRVEELNPMPNTELSEKDYRVLAKKLKYSSKVEDIVKIIFDKNPTDIGNKYKGQETLYAKQIIERNKNCFEEKGDLLIFAKDTLKHIPSYVKEK